MADQLTNLGTVGVGLTNSAGAGLNGQQVAMVCGPQQEQLTSQLHGKYFEQARRGNLFFAGITGQVTTVGLATTYTGLCLSNPVGSGKLLIVDRVTYAFLVAFAAGSAIGIMTGYNATTNVTHTTPVTVRCSRINGSFANPAAVGLVDSSATLPTAPVVHSLFDAGLTGAITTMPKAGPNVVDLEGMIVLDPGAYCAIYTSTASGAASMAAAFQWHEIAA